MPIASYPQAVNHSSRQVVLRHPNSFDVTVSRKVVKRSELDGNGNPSEMGGYPTMGEMGVLSVEDEAEFEYVPRGTDGAGKMMFVAAPFAGTDMIRADNALVPETAREVLIEATAEPDNPGYFVADNNDLVLVTMAPGVVMAYEVVQVTGNVNIPPYTRRLLVNPRDDLNYVEPFEG